MTLQNIRKLEEQLLNAYQVVGIGTRQPDQTRQQENIIKMNLDEQYKNAANPKEKLLFLAIHLLGWASDNREKIDQARLGIGEYEVYKRADLAVLIAQYRGIAEAAEKAGVELRDLLIDLGWIVSVDGVFMVLDKKCPKCGHEVYSIDLYSISLDKSKEKAGSAWWCENCHDWFDCI